MKTLKQQQASLIEDLNILSKMYHKKKEELEQITEELNEQTFITNNNKHFLELQKMANKTFYHQEQDLGIIITEVSLNQENTKEAIVKFITTSQQQTLKTATITLEPQDLLLTLTNIPTSQFITL